VLDDGPLGVLASVVPLSEFLSWPTDLFAVAKPTWDAFVQSGHATKAEFVRDCRMQVFDIVLGGEASHMLFTHLRADPASKAGANLAEHMAIAWLAHEQRTAQLVTTDKRAFYLASAELGAGRVAHACDVWDWLFEQGLFDLIVRREAVRLTMKSANMSVPYRYSRR